MRNYLVLVYIISRSKNLLRPVESSRRTVRGRNGYIFDGLTYSEKTITVTARLKVNTIADFLLFKDKLNAWILGDDSFYIELLFESEPTLYNFELPGQKTGRIRATT